MARLSDKLRTLATVLILSLALALGFSSGAEAVFPGPSAGLLDIADVHHASSPHDPCMRAPYHDPNADCCSAAAHCSGAGCSAFVAPVDTPGFASSAHRKWTSPNALRLQGIDPPVNRHPPRDLG